MATLKVKKGRSFTDAFQFIGGTRPVSAVCYPMVSVFKLVNGQISGYPINLTPCRGKVVYLEGLTAPKTVQGTMKGKINLQPGEYHLSFDCSMTMMKENFSLAVGSLFYTKLIVVP